MKPYAPPGAALDTIRTSHPARTRDIVAALRAPCACEVIEVRPGSAGALWAKDDTDADDPLPLSLFGYVVLVPAKCSRRGRTTLARSVPAAA